MNISILSAKTGYGHTSVLYSIYDSLKNYDYHIELFPSFYEELNDSNKFISDFYALIQRRSMKMAVILNEMTVLEGNKKKNELYDVCKHKLDEFFSTKRDIIISVTPLINIHLIRYIQENNLQNEIKLFIVVTDAYDPIYPGFDVKGAEAYFCANDIVKKQLSDKDIDEEKIIVSGFPLKKCYFEPKTDKDLIMKKDNISSKFVILINLGSVGDTDCYNFIIEVIHHIWEYCHIIIICGENKYLYKLINFYVERNKFNNITIYGFVSNMHEILDIADICITKAGANTIHECIVTKTLPLIYSFNGLYYQEQGVFRFLSQYGLDLKFDNVYNIVKFIKNSIENNRLAEITNRIKNTKLRNGSEFISLYLHNFIQNNY